MRSIVRAAAVGTALLLAGCLLPDKYDAEISLGDGTYETRLTGEGTMLMAYGDYQDPSADKAKLDKDMATYEATVNKQKGYSIKHKGNARFDVKYADQGKVPQNTPAEAFLGFIIISRTTDGYAIKSAATNKANHERVVQAGLRSIGDICIKTDLAVVEHNADTPPGAGSRCYTWRNFDALSDRTISIRVKR